MENRIKRKDIPFIKNELMIKQRHKCLVCGVDLRTLNPKMRHLHHNHSNGYIVGVLCGKCNQFEGRALNWFIRTGLRNTGIDIKKVYNGLIKLYKRPNTKYIHWSFKTNEEKKALRKKRRKK